MKRKHTAPAASTGGLPQPMAAPQLEFVDGRIVVRESSLVVGAEPNMLLEEGEAQNPATYHSYRPKSANASARWGIEETRFFFRAIQQVGQDFSLMQGRSVLPFEASACCVLSHWICSVSSWENQRSNQEEIRQVSIHYMRFARRLLSSPGLPCVGKTNRIQSSSGQPYRTACL